MAEHEPKSMSLEEWSNIVHQEGVKIAEILLEQPWEWPPFIGIPTPDTRWSRFKQILARRVFKIANWLDPDIECRL